MKLVTKRLILREPSKKDAKDVVENLNNLNVSRYMHAVPYPYTMKDSKEHINKYFKKIKKKPRIEYMFCIELKAENKVIGTVGVHDIDKYQGTAIIGYWLGEKYWHQGIMSEALKEILDFIFNKLKLRKIEAHIYAKANKESAKLLEKFGFKKEGILREAERTASTGKIYDDHVFGLLRKEY